MKSKNQDDRLADKQEEKQIGRPTGRTDIQINLYRQINRYEKWHAEKKNKKEQITITKMKQMKKSKR